MSQRAGAVGAGAGTGAAGGAAQGYKYGGPWGALIGAGVGATVGGTSGWFGGRALEENEEAQQAALDRYTRAIRDYSMGMDRAQRWEQGEYGKLAAQELGGQAKYMQNMQTGQQAAAQMQGGYAQALKQAQGTMAGAGDAPTQGVNQTLASNYQQEAVNRAMNPLQSAAMEQGMANVKMMASNAAQTYGLDQAKLNSQLAQIANTSGIEKATLAARFATATGQYPMDMFEAQNAGASNAMIFGLGQGVLAGGKGGGSQYWGNQDKMNRARSNPGEFRQNTNQNVFGTQGDYDYSE